MNCSKNDCGNNETNAFTYLHEAMFVLDKIIENDSLTISQYPYMANNYVVNNSISIFYLSQNGSHTINFTLLNNTNPCDPTTSDCLFRFFNHHTYPATTVIQFKAYTSSQAGANIFINTQMIILYSNYILKLEDIAL